MKSAAFDTFMEDLCESRNVPLRVCYEKSFCLSADVTAAYDPNFADVYEKRNSALVNGGVGLCKYTGSRGKSGASDASAAGVPVLSMHSPFETVGKLDCYMTFKGMKAIYEAR